MDDEDVEIIKRGRNDEPAFFDMSWVSSPAFTLETLNDGCIVIYEELDEELI